MGASRRVILPAALGVLVLAAAAFAIVAGDGSGGGSTTASGPTAGTTVGAPPASGGGFEGAELPSGVVAPEISLSDQYGRPVALSSLRGRPVVIAFLYSSCGAACVLIAQQIRGALNELPSPVPVLIVSADPAADTPAAVRRFLAQVSLSGRVYYLTGTQAQLESVWRAYRVRPASAGAAAFAKYATVLLLDGRGRERVAYGTEQLTPEALSRDIRRLQGP